MVDKLVDKMFNSSLECNILIKCENESILPNFVHNATMNYMHACLKRLHQLQLRMFPSTKRTHVIVRVANIW